VPRRKALPDPDGDDDLPAVEVAEPEAPEEPEYVSEQPGGPGIGWVTMMGDGGRMS
jgi:hypothetical protein